VSHRERLPQLDGGPFLTDGGIETVLIFHQGVELPEFAAFDLLKDADGTERLRAYYGPYLALARERDLGFVLESPTWLGQRHRLRRGPARRVQSKGHSAPAGDPGRAGPRRRADRDQRVHRPA
jgi:hypothetical protein